MKTDPIAIGKRIKATLEKAGLTQRALAQKLQVTDPTISAYIKGTAGVPAEVYAVISELGDVSIDWLITGKEQTVAANRVSEPAQEYKPHSPETERLLKILEKVPTIRKSIETMAKLPEDDQIIQLGEQLKNLKRLEEDK